jgi:WD40 repeat protein
MKTAGKGPIASIQFVNDNRAFVCRQGTPGAMLYDSKAGKEILSLPDAAGVLAIAPDRKSFVGAYAGWTTLQRWDLTTGKPLWSDERELGHTGDIYRLAFSPDGCQLASSSEDGTLRIWDVKSKLIMHLIR